MTQEEMTTEIHGILLTCNNFEDGELSIAKAERKILHLINTHVKEVIGDYEDVSKDFDEMIITVGRNRLKRQQRLRAGIEEEK